MDKRGMTGTEDGSGSRVGGGGGTPSQAPKGPKGPKTPPKKAPKPLPSVKTSKGA